MDVTPKGEKQVSYVDLYHSNDTPRVQSVERNAKNIDSLLRENRKGLRDGYACGSERMRKRPDRNQLVKSLANNQRTSSSAL